MATMVLIRKNLSVKLSPTTSPARMHKPYELPTVEHKPVNDGQPGPAFCHMIEPTHPAL